MNIKITFPLLDDGGTLLLCDALPLLDAGAALLLCSPLLGLPYSWPRARLTPNNTTAMYILPLQCGTSHCWVHHAKTIYTVAVPSQAACLYTQPDVT